MSPEMNEFFYGKEKDDDENDENNEKEKKDV